MEASGEIISRLLLLEQLYLELSDDLARPAEHITTRGREMWGCPSAEGTTDPIG